MPDLLPADLIAPLLGGAVLTVQLTFGSAVVGLVVSFLAGIAALSRFFLLRAISRVYVEVFRGTSALVQLFFWFYVLPFIGVTLDPFPTGLIGLGLNVGAYGAEIVRASIVNVDPGQREAALVLNMSSRHTLTRIVLPQAWIAMLPPFGNLLIDLLKLTSLASLITITELSYAGISYIQRHGNVAVVYTAVLVMYFLMAFPLTRLMHVLERRAAFGVGVGRAE